MVELCYSFQPFFPRTHSRKAFFFFKSSQVLSFAEYFNFPFPYFPSPFPQLFIRYSVDAGSTWTDFNFLEHQLGLQIQVTSIGTVPDCSSKKFVIWGTVAKTSDPDLEMDHQLAVFVDFEGLGLSQCNEKELELWSPVQTSQNNSLGCFFGHKVQYQRKKEGIKCFMNEAFQDPVKLIDNCLCTRSDFQW